MAKIKYIVDGKPMMVDQANEKAFLEAMKGKKVEKASKEEPDKENSGNQTALLGDATVEQTTTASTQEVTQPQNNQQENTESKSETTSSESQEEENKEIFSWGEYYFYHHGGKKHKVHQTFNSQFVKAHPGAVRVHKHYKNNNVDTYNFELKNNPDGSKFEHMSVDDMVEATGSKWSLTKEGNFVEAMNEHYKDQPVKFVEASVGNDAVRILIGDHDSESYDKSEVFSLEAQWGNNLINPKATANNMTNLGLWVFADANKDVMQDMINYIDKKTNRDFSNQVDKELYNIIGNSAEVNYASTAKGMQSFFDVLDRAQGITPRDRISYDPQARAFKNTIDPSGTITLGGREWS